MLKAKILSFWKKRMLEYPYDLEERNDFLNRKQKE